MWDLMDMHLGSGRLNDLRARTYGEYKRNGYHQLPEVWTQKAGVYTFRLRNLIHRCLDPNPANRPSQIELYDETLAGYRMAKRRVGEAKEAAELEAQTTGEPPRESLHSLTSSKLYYKGHSINQMPLGDACFEASFYGLQRLVLDTYLNPDLPRLKVPTTKWGDVLESVLWKDMKEDDNWRVLYSDTNSCRMWFKGVQDDWGDGGADDKGDGDGDGDKGGSGESEGPVRRGGRRNRLKKAKGKGPVNARGAVQKTRALDPSQGAWIRLAKQLEALKKQINDDPLLAPAGRASEEGGVYESLPSVSQMHARH